MTKKESEKMEEGRADKFGIGITTDGTGLAIFSPEEAKKRIAARDEDEATGSDLDIGDLDSLDSVFSKKS